MELIIEAVTKSFGSKAVLKGASFRFQHGKIYGLLGRNGAGKTTLFNCICRALNYEAGTIDFATGRDDLGPEDQAGFVYTQPLLPEFLTGYEFLKFFLTANERRIAEPQSIEYYCDMVQLDQEDRHRLIKGYSHGMKSKLQLLTVLITKPPVFLLDEPLTSFDVVVALEIKNLLKELKKEHIIILSTHILQLAADLCDEIVLLHNGVLQEIDTNLLGKPEFEESIKDLLSVEQDV